VQSRQGDTFQSFAYIATNWVGAGVVGLGAEPQNKRRIPPPSSPSPAPTAQQASKRPETAPAGGSRSTGLADSSIPITVQTRREIGLALPCSSRLEAAFRLASCRTLSRLAASCWAASTSFLSLGMAVLAARISSALARAYAWVSNLQ